MRFPVQELVHIDQAGVPRPREIESRTADWDQDPRARRVVAPIKMRVIGRISRNFNPGPRTGGGMAARAGDSLLPDLEQRLRCLRLRSLDGPRSVPPPGRDASAILFRLSSTVLLKLGGGRESRRPRPYSNWAERQQSRQPRPYSNWSGGGPEPATTSGSSMKLARPGAW
jgi:hypothetical protein